MWEEMERSGGGTGKKGERRNFNWEEITSKKNE